MFNLSKYNPNNNKIVFRCNGQGFGGLGDRMIGLCSSFILSLILNFEFRIYWTYPIDLNNILDEKNIKWTTRDYDMNEILKNNGELNLIDFNVNKNKHILENNIYKIFNKTISIVSNKAFYLYLMNNKYLESRLLELNIINEDNIIHNCMSILFALKPSTQLKYNNLLFTFSKYHAIGLQIRSFIGEFFDNLDESKLLSYYKFIEDNYEKYNNNLLIYLCTDSDVIVKHITQKYSHINFILTSNTIIHLERSTETNINIENNLKLILEIWSLGKTKELMITNSSNFGRIASLLSQKIPYINNNMIYEYTTFNNILSKDKFD